MIELSKIDR